MQRNECSFFNVILGGFGATDEATTNNNKEQRPVKSGNADDAAFLMKNASSVIIVPVWNGSCPSPTCFERNGRYFKEK